MVIYLEQYRVTKEAPVSLLKNGTYGEEIMNSNWNPAVIYIFNEAAQGANDIELHASPDLPEDLSTIDVNAFLGRVYALATQI